MANGSLPTPRIGRLPGPFSDQLKNYETPAMILVEVNLPLAWSQTRTVLFTRQMKVCSIYTGIDDTAEGVYH